MRALRWALGIGLSAALPATAAAAVAEAASPPSLQATPSGSDAARAKGSPAHGVARFVVAGGGGHSVGGAFGVRGTISQVDADPLQPSTGGAYAVTGGFWAGGAGSSAGEALIFRSGFED